MYDSRAPDCASMREVKELRHSFQPLEAVGLLVSQAPLDRAETWKS